MIFCADYYGYCLQSCASRTIYHILGSDAHTSITRLSSHCINLVIHPTKLASKAMTDAAHYKYPSPLAGYEDRPALPEFVPVALIESSFVC